MFNSYFFAAYRAVPRERFPRANNQWPPSKPPAQFLAQRMRAFQRRFHKTLGGLGCFINSWPRARLQVSAAEKAHLFRG